MFNNNIISDAFLVVKISKPLLPEKNVQVLDVLSRDGEIFNGSKYAPVEYDVEILVQGDDEFDLRNNLKTLRDILSTKSPVKLSFMKDRYGYGMVTDKITMEQKSRLDVLCKVHIKCFNPLFYSTTERMFTNEEDLSVLKIDNQGGVGVKPFITVGFTQNANFLQLQNQVTMETILLGSYPKLEYSTVDERKDILYDTCTTTGNWATSTLPIDNNRANGGTLGVVSGKAGLCIGALPSTTSTEKWKGVEVRRNLDSPQDEFKITAEMTFTSTGVNGDPTIVPVDKETVTAGETTTYYVVNVSALNVRELPTTNSRITGTVAKGIEFRGQGLVIVNNSWLQYKNTNGDIRYVSMKYLTKKTETSTITKTKRNVVINRTPTSIYSSPSTNSTRLKILNKGDVVRIDTTTKYASYENNMMYYWWKLAIPKDGVTGYVCDGNLYPWNSSTGAVYKIEYDDAPETADDKVGVLELYGMGPNNERLFKIAITDDNEYYEYTSPSITLGTDTILCRDSTLISPPKSYTETTTSGTKTTNYLSGAVGNWNDFYGTISLSRTRDKSGNFIWEFNIAKINNGIVEINKKGSLQLDNKATENLSYIILYMGTYNSLEKCSDMALNSLRVQGITTSYEDNVNKVQFREGDIIDIDFENRNVYLNYEKRNDLVNISSRYFNIEKGINDIKIFSNDANAIVGAAINEAWMGDE